MAKISKTTSVEIERRKAEARPLMLADLAQVVAGRGGAITNGQVTLVGALLARTVPVGNLKGELTGWLARNDVQGSAIEQYFAEAEWTVLLAQAVEVAASAWITVRISQLTGAATGSASTTRRRSDWG